MHFKQVVGESGVRQFPSLIQYSFLKKKPGRQVKHALFLKFWHPGTKKLHKLFWSTKFLLHREHLPLTSYKTQLETLKIQILYPFCTIGLNPVEHLAQYPVEFNYKHLKGRLTHLELSEIRL